MWMEMAVASTLFAMGGILFGHFERGTPAWRRLLKLFLFLGLTALLAATAGSAWALGWIAGMLLLGTSVHFWWCRRHGIDPWTAEPRERYEQLRRWRS
jgi:hypothetical protein